jgi:peptidoglycan/LPS O-acetylase OafA/YrhL
MPALDGLRGIAVLLVMLSHSPHTANPATYRLFHVQALDRFAWGGFLGVDVFFVLSGFLITSLLLSEHRTTGSVQFRRFYLRRASRLLPALLVLLVAHFLYVSYAHLPTSRETSTAVSALLYVTNYVVAWRPHAISADMSHLWTLAVEEQFYLVWPVAVLALARRRAWLFPSAVVGVVAAVTVNRVLTWDSDHPIDAFVRSDTRADALLIGALAGWIWTNGFTPVRLRGLSIGAVAVMCLCIEFGRGDYAWLYLGGFTVFAVAAAVVVLDAANGGFGFLHFPPLRAVGRISYGLYLWHVPVFDATVRHIHTSPWTRVAIAWALSFVAAVASWRLVERYVLELRDKPLSVRS